MLNQFTHTRISRPKHPLRALLLCAGLFALPFTTSQARGGHASELSAVSALPLISVAALSATAVEASNTIAEPLAALSEDGSRWVVRRLERGSQGVRYVVARSSDGFQLSLESSRELGGQSLLAVGTVITTSTSAAGLLLSTAGEVIAWLPNELGHALSHHQALQP